MQVVHRMRQGFRADRKRTLAIAIAAALPLIGFGQRADASTWTDPVAVDPGISSTGNANNLFNSTIALKDGDVVKMGQNLAAGSPNGAGLNNFVNYYVVGVGSTPSTTFKLTTFSPSNGLVSAATAGSAASTLLPQWFTPSDWGGAVPNAVDAVATLGTAGTPLTNTKHVLLNGDATIGTLNFNSANDLSLKSTIIGNSGPLATLTFATSAGTPTITVAGGGSFMLSDAQTSNTALNSNNTVNGGVQAGINNGNVQARLTIAGTQGLVIDNQNAIGTITLANAPAASTPGAFRFGYQLDWSKLSGTLTLQEGAFALDGSTSSNNLSALPIKNEVILGTGTTSATRAQMEMDGNQGIADIRGLTSGNTFSSIVNVNNAGGPSLTFGSYTAPGETYTYNGTVGGDAVYSGSTPIQLTGRLRFVKLGADTQVMNGRMEMTSGALMGINGGTFSLGTSGAMGTSFDANGQGTSIYSTALPGTPASTNLDTNNIWMHNGELKMDGTGLAFARTQNFASLIQGNGGDSTSGASAGNNFSNASSGLSTFTLVAGTGQPITLTFAGIRARNEYGNASVTGNANGITYLFRGTGLGTNAPGTAGSGTANIVFTNVFGPGTTGTGGGGTTPGVPVLVDTVSGLGITGTVHTTNYGVIKGALADTSGTGTGAGFATYEQNGDNGSTTTLGVRLLAADEQDTSGYGTAGPTINTRLNLAGATPITGVTSQTLQLDNTSGSPQTVTNTGTALYATQGFLFSGSSAITLTGGTITGTASGTNNEDVVILSTNTAGTTIASAVSNPGAASHAGWITYGGSGNFTITGNQTVANSGGIALNSTGTTLLNAICNGAGSTVSVLALNQGTLQLGSSFAINAGVNAQVAAGTTLDLNGLATTTFGGLNPSASYGSFVNNLNNAGGTVTNAPGNPTATLILGGGAGAATFPGTIQGNINLQIGRVGGTVFTQTLNGVNTYTGTTTVMNGSTLNVARYGLLPAGTSVTLGEAGTNTVGFFSLGDSLSSGTLINGAVNQTIAGLFTAGTPATGPNSAVLGNDLNPSILTVNYTGGSPDSFSGIIGSATAGVANNLTLRKTGSGTLVLNTAVLGGGTPTTGANFYTGGTIIEAGTLSVSRDNLLGGIGPVAPGIAAAPTPTSVIANNININGGTLQATGTFTLGDSFSATTPAVPNRRGVGLGPVQGSVGGTGTIEVTAANTLTDNAPIASAGNTGTNNLVKTGTGTLLLSAANTYVGNTSVKGGVLNVTGSLVNNASNSVFVAVDPDGSFGTSDDILITRAVTAVTGSYKGQGSTEIGGLASSADLKQGLNASGSDVSETMMWRLRAVNETDDSHPPLLFGATQLASDVLSLSGMVNSGAASGQTDPFALQMTYDETLVGDEAGHAVNSQLFLQTLDTSGVPQWVNAVALDIGTGGSAVTSYQGSYAAFALANSITDANVGNFLGSWGVDTVSNTAWAVVNHNSQFAVSAVPEPTGLAVLALGAVGLLGRRRRAAR